MTRYQIRALILSLSLFLLVISACDKIKTHMGKMGISMGSTDDWKTGICADRLEGNIYIEKTEIDPIKVERDDEFEQRLEYTYCAPPDVQEIQVEITRRVIFRGKEIFRKSSTQHIDAGPGNVKAEIEVPERASLGTYTLETTIRYEGKTVSRSDTFIVIPN